MNSTWISVYPPLAPRAWGRARADVAAFPLGSPGCRLFGQARQGLWKALAGLQPEAGQEVLMPAYHHGSEVETVIRAGFHCRFYQGLDGIQPDDQELEGLINERTRALYLVHTLGFVQDPVRWRTWCDLRGLVLIEDAAQAWLSGHGKTAAGALGDISIFCLYKPVPMPDGGALLTTRGLAVAPPVAPARGGARGVGRLHRNYLSARVRQVARIHTGPGTAHERDEIPRREFEPSPLARRPARASVLLASRVDASEVAAKRRRNYQYLRERLDEHVPAPFRHLDEAVSPLAFPVQTDDKRGLLDHLAARGIVDGKLWAVPHPLLPLGRFGHADALRERLVGLPLHQDLREDDILRVANAAESWFGGGRR